eukprot:g12123.t1
MTMITSVRFWNLMALIESNSIFSGSWYFLEKFTTIFTARQSEGSLPGSFTRAEKPPTISKATTRQMRIAAGYGIRESESREMA